MERPYPYRPVNLPIERLSLYFDTDEVPAFHAVNAALAQSIVLWSPNLHLHGNILGIQFLLANTYGGSTLLYPISPWECGSFIIKLPNYLNRDQVLAEFLPWCVDRNILLTPWDPNLYLCRQPTFGYRLDIIVNGFPIPLWHEYFIIKFLSALGNVVYVNGDNLLGRDKSCISAVIYCLDPRAVPRLVAVHFLNFWADVRVHIREWDDYPHIPLRLRPFPDFADPNDPFGDDPTEEDMSSPVRAHLVSCHDSMRALFIPDEEQPQIPLPQPQVVTNRAYCIILTKGLIKVGQFNLFPEYTALGVQLCVAALILSVHRRNTQSRRGNPQASVWPCMPSLPPKPPRGSMRFKYSTTPKSQPSKYKTQFLSPLSYQTEALHVLHVEEPPEHTTTQRFANLQGKSGESNLGLSYANIPFVCLTPSCQVDPSTCMCATTIKEFFINAHCDCQTKMTPVPPKKSCQLEPDLYSGKQHLKPECNKNPNCMQKAPSPPCAYKNPTTPPLPSPQTPPCSILGPHPTLRNSRNTLSKMNSSDEISTLFSFIAPDSASSSRRITIPHQITASRDWSLSCLARVMTDRTVFDDNFTNMMMRDWEANPRTRISPIAKNTYLVDFATAKEMYEVLEKEPWFYRTDVVSMRKVHEPSQLKSDFVEHVSLWTQFHNVPPEMLSAEGIYYLAGLIGTPVSEVRQGYNAGRLFMRVKTSYSVLKGLQDSIPLDHPTLGPISIFLVYERASRLCIFCGGIGHVISGCAQRSRVLQLCADPINANRPELVLLRDYRRGPWINCSALVPRETLTDPQPTIGSPPTSPPIPHYPNTNQAHYPHSDPTPLPQAQPEPITANNLTIHNLITQYSHFHSNPSNNSQRL